jgi:hypothetical protein
MIDEHTTGYKAQFMSITEYAADRARTGFRIFPGGPGTFWIGFGFGAMMRIPIFHLVPPASDELQQVLWHGPATIASYLMEPDERHPANTWLYLCTDQTYALEKLAPAMRRNVRRGLRELRIASLTYDQLLAHGAQAFCDTRRRVGLRDGTLEEFQQRFTTRRLPEVAILGAWKDNQLAGFLSITQVDDWADITGNFSMDDLREYRPSDTLVYSALSHYLVERKCRLVTYTMSSIEADSNAEGLHRYKKKVGFEARPVHRAFVPHPLLRPLANRLTLWGVNTALRFMPADLRLKKASGVLASMLGDTRLVEAEAKSASDE